MEGKTANMKIDREEGRRLFGADADNYDQIRPDYPEDIYAYLCSRQILGRGTITLEIGAGSGLATRRLIELGANPLTVIEPDKRFFSQLQALGDNECLEFRVLDQPFEQANLPGRFYQLVVAATSYHWLEPELRLQRIAELLKPGGHVALWWNVFQDPDRADPFHEATSHLLSNLPNSPSAGNINLAFALDTRARLDEFRRSGKFLAPQCQVFAWTLVLNPEEVVSLYRTFSPLQQLPEERRTKILETLREIAEKQFGGKVERNMTSPLYVAQVMRT